jgi:LuxR family transcriptional regulator, regulator of acetate metabolism
VPTDSDLLRATLRNAARRTGLPVVFAGPVDRGRIALSEFLGTTTSALRGVSVRHGTGLGGKALALETPCYVEDYASAKAISHEYDTAVGREGLRSLVAVPLRVGSRTRAVVYGGVREQTSLGSRVTDALVDAVREGERELAVLDEVDRRLADRLPVPDLSAAAVLERVRGTHAELRALAGTVEDEVLRTRLLALCEGLTGSARGPVTLSARETDVLALVARGRTNADVGLQLGIGSETVKSYLRSAMAKLGATTRLEAVSQARAEGLLP